MSLKEMVIQAVQSLPEDCTLEDVLSSLRGVATAGLGGSPFKHSSDWDADELTDDQWRAYVVQGLNAELSDSREDIYTEEDGEPVDGTR